MDLDDQKPGPKNELAKGAVQAMGTEAVPTITRMLRLRESWLDIKFRELAAKQSFVKFKVIPLTEGHRHAVLACYQLGPKALDAIPSLIALLNSGFTRGYVGAAMSRIGPEFVVPATQAFNSTNVQVRCEILHCLGSMLAYSSNNITQISNAVPVLLAGLKDQSPYARSSATMAFYSLIKHSKGDARLDANLIVPELIKLLDDEDRQTRRCATLALGKFGTGASAAVPRLEKLLDDADAEISGGVALVLLQITPEKESKVMPALMRNLDGPAKKYFRGETIETLPLCLNHTNLTVPALSRIAQDESSPTYERFAALEALKKISPALAQENLSRELVDQLRAEAR